jgi:voltage-gated potassium channel
MEEAPAPETPPERSGMSRARILAILDGEDPAFGRPVALFLQFLIVLSLVTITLQSISGLPPLVSDILAVEEWVVVGVFTVEYLLRLFAAPRPLRYATSFLGLVDLAAILPTLLLLNVDTRGLRALRVFRVLRLFKMMRYVAAFDRLTRALVAVREELVVFAGIGAVVLYLAATGIYFLENEAQPEAFGSIPDAMWWAVVTLTTVGYGDVYPVTTGGRIFTGLILLLALGVIAIPTGLVATALARDAVPPQRRQAESSPDDQAG